MRSIKETIPLRCQSCHYFIDTVEGLQRIEEEVLSLNTSEKRAQFAAEQNIPLEHVARHFGEQVIKLAELKDKLDQDKIYSVGCPGFDMSSSTETGEAVRGGRCRSPILDL